MASLTIRPAALSDVADLGMIHYQSWLQTYTGLIDQNFLNQLSAQRSQQRFEAEGCKQFFDRTGGWFSCRLLPLLQKPRSRR